MTHLILTDAWQVAAFVTRDNVTGAPETIVLDLGVPGAGICHRHELDEPAATRQLERSLMAKAQADELGFTIMALHVLDYVNDGRTYVVTVNVLDRLIDELTRTLRDFAAAYDVADMAARHETMLTYRTGR